MREIKFPFFPLFLSNASNVTQPRTVTSPYIPEVFEKVNEECMLSEVQGRTSGRTWAGLNEKCPLSKERVGVITYLKSWNKNYLQPVEVKMCIAEKIRTHALVGRLFRKLRKISILWNFGASNLVPFDK